MQASSIGVSRRGVIVFVALALAIVGAGQVAFAAFPADNVKLYTGCLTSGGNINYVAEGDNPSQPCSSPKRVVKLSGGDITSLTVTAPLTGGGTNGALTIGLDTKFTLPGTCSDGQVPKWNASDESWSCGDDNDTTYSAGTGLDVSSGGQFSVEAGYRLPQGCDVGDLIRSTSGGGWECIAPSSSSPTSYEATQADPVEGVDVPDDGSFHEVIGLNLPAGKYFVTSTGSMMGENVKSGGAATDQSIGDCVLYSGGTVDRADYDAIGVAYTSVAFSRVVTLGAAGRVNVQCKASSSYDMAAARGFEIVAIAVA